MSKGIYEGGADTRTDQKKDAPRENDLYAEYQKIGGIINMKDYESAYRRSIETITVSDAYRNQAEAIAKFAGIELQNTKGAVDPRVKLYAVLRGDEKPEGVKEHHAQMSDQRLFAEVLRMLGDTDALEKLTSAYPNIAFD